MEKEDDILDKILIYIGDFGKKQAISFVLICIVVIFNSATHMAYVFTAMDSDYRCFVPGCDDTNSSFQETWLNNTVPFTVKGKPKKCEVYERWTNYSGEETCSLEAFDTSHVKQCESLVFKDGENYIGKEYDLLCENNVWKLSLVGTINTIGNFFGLLLTGIVSDRHGRKIVLLLGISLCGATGLIKSFAPSFVWFCCMEFLEALFASGSYGSAFILGVELVVPKNRVWTGCVLFTCYATGEVLIGVVAWLVRDWKWIIYIVYGPCIFVILFYWAIPESVRWYLSKGEVNKPKEILKRFANSNGKNVPESYFFKLNRNTVRKDDNRSLKFSQMLKSRTLLIRLSICIFLWITCALLFYGLTLNSVSLAGNYYLNFIYISLIEIPAYWIDNFVVEKFGRKFSLSGSYALIAVSCLSFTLFGNGPEWIRLVLYCLGKFGATSAFLIVYIITSEIFPTPYRHTIFALCSMIGRIGSMASPQIPLLGLLWVHFPLVLFTVTASLSSILALFLPETLNKKLPDTVGEAEKLGQKIDESVNSAI